MRITLLRPIGLNEPGDVVDVDPRLGGVLVEHGFAHPVEGEARQMVEPQGVTLAQLRSVATEHGVSLKEARDMMVTERAALREGGQPCR